MDFLHRFSIRKALGAAIAAAMLAQPGAARPSDSTEAIKAAFIYNFARFTEWPAGSFAETDSYLRVCYVRGDSMAQALETIDGKSVGTRSIMIVAVAPDGSFPGSCHINIVPSGGGPSDQIPVRGQLTVADIGAIGDSDAAVSLVQVGRQIRFQVDVTLVELAELRMSSKLLRLAIRVER